MEIVRLTNENAHDFGQVICDSWGETYRGLIPDEILDNRKAERWTERARLSPEGKYLAYADGRAVGAIGFLKQARDFCTHRQSCEIVCLYVLKEFHRRGIGRALMEKAFADLGDRDITLFVLKGNDNAAGFYEHMGFEFTGRELDEGGMTELEMFRKAGVL
ncbi:GNAT family N-acetyltransferase [Ruminococcus sp.]|uniref:GNAT family N-acetyltransferase n=1 Tax=Ruminococcus sp. TaxID=41978 RepID=UPI0025CBF50C|nr:GNAT family N-acetyltransferase [Ruminococcus sp.]MBQ8965607.1 GNAT family N-acetyltransferase [Ruminococcus sp.]